MLSWNAPTSNADICSSLRLVGYYQGFIEGILKDHQAHDQVTWEG
jgi:hypothetical protein